MDKRIFGLRNEYSVVFSTGGQRQLSPEEVGRRLFGPVVSGGQGHSVLLSHAKSGGTVGSAEPGGRSYRSDGCLAPLNGRAVAVGRGHWCSAV